MENEQLPPNGDEHLAPDEDELLLPDIDEQLSQDQDEQLPPGGDEQLPQDQDEPIPPDGDEDDPLQNHLNIEGLHQAELLRAFERAVQRYHVQEEHRRIMRLYHQNEIRERQRQEYIRQRQQQQLREEEIAWNELRRQHQEDNRLRLEQLQQGQQGNQLLLQQQPAQAGIPHNLLLRQQPPQNLVNYGILMPQQRQPQLQIQPVGQQQPQPAQAALTVDQIQQLIPQQMQNQLLPQQPLAQAGIPHNLLLGQQPPQHFMNYGILMPQQRQPQLQNQLVVQQQLQPTQPAMTVEQFQHLLRQQPLEMQNQINQLIRLMEEYRRNQMAENEVRQQLEQLTQWQNQLQLQQNRPPAQQREPNGRPNHVVQANNASEEQLEQLARWIAAVIQSFENNQQGQDRFLELLRQQDRFKNLCQNGATNAEVDAIISEHIEQLIELLYGAPNLVIGINKMLSIGSYIVGINAEGRYFYTRPNVEPKVIMSPEERQAQREAVDEESEAENGDPEVADGEAEAEVEEPELENPQSPENVDPNQQQGTAQPAADPHIHQEDNGRPPHVAQAEHAQREQSEEAEEVLRFQGEEADYVRKVEQRLVDDVDIFNAFLDIMRAFKANEISPAEAILVISRLFDDAQDLVLEFNKCLPHGFNIVVNAEGRYVLTSPNEEPKVIVTLEELRAQRALEENGEEDPEEPQSLQNVDPSPQQGTSHPAPEPSTLPDENGKPPHMAEAEHAQRGQMKEADKVSLYCEKIQQQFANDMPKYYCFLKIMREFKANKISPAEITEKVIELFYDTRDLVLEFNKFLPAGCRIAVNAEGRYVYTSSNVETKVIMSTEERQAQRAQTENNGAEPEQPRLLQDEAPAQARGPVQPATDPAYNFLRKVKRRYVNDVPRYKRFVAIVNALSNRAFRAESIAKVIEVLYDSRDLVLEFNKFLPDGYRIAVNAEDKYVFTSPNREPKIIMSPEERQAQRAQAGNNGAGPEQPRLLQNKAPMVDGQHGGQVQPAPDLNIHLRVIETVPEEEVEPQEPVKRLPGLNETVLYLKKVKKQFVNDLPGYNQFMMIMRDLRAEKISPVDASEQVIKQMYAHPNLVYEFNAFLPIGFGIDATVEDIYFIISPNQESKYVTTPELPPRAQVEDNGAAAVPVN